MKIFHKITGAVLLDYPADNPQGANLQGANLQGANLRHANLRHADLQGANLQGANLQGANLRHANLRHANLQGADLRHANLQGADPQGADLRGADLQGADLLGEILTKQPLFIYGQRWDITITDGYMTIGCQRHTHEKWSQFGDAEIVSMDRQALRFWRHWRDALLAMCAAHTADKED